MNTNQSLDMLEQESIHIIRETMAKFKNPIMLFSLGKDSMVLLHLAMKAFFPTKIPFKLLHIDTQWKFKEMYEFRNKIPEWYNVDLEVYINPEGKDKINPFTHGSEYHTRVMKTEALKQALTKYGIDAALCGARRDEEAVRAKERIFSYRNKFHQWDPVNQRPELFGIYNTFINHGESCRVFPLSNWTELDVWKYIQRENIPIVDLYYAAVRPVIERNGVILNVNDDRMDVESSETVMMSMVRFRSLGCYPLTGAIPSEACSLDSIIKELQMESIESERATRLIDQDTENMEHKKRNGYF